MKKLKDIIMNLINGFCMALADSVPGVSGGTIAFLLGFYDKFIGSLDDLFRGKMEQKKTALIAVARKLLVLIWNMLSKKEAFNPEYKSFQPLFRLHKKT